MSNKNFFFLIHLKNFNKSLLFCYKKCSFSFPLKLYNKKQYYLKLSITFTKKLQKNEKKNFCGFEFIFIFFLFCLI